MTEAAGPDGGAFLDDLAAVEQPASETYASLEATGLGDGLPVGAVTATLVSEMMAAAGVGADDVVASVRPLRGQLTGRRLAVCAALAGCRPDHVPVVVAAVQALEVPEINALGFLSTTSNAALMAVVSGPAASTLGFNGGANCLGPGNRSNAVVGRALSLVTRMVGGAREGHADMATLGQPAKYTFCFAENAEASPWPPLHVDRGLAADQSAVTVLGVAGCVEAFESHSYQPDDMIASLAPTLAATAPVVFPQRGVLGGGYAAVIVSPEWAQAFSEAGLSRRDLQEALLERARRPEPELASLPVAARREDLLVVVAGGPGIKQTVVPGWAGGSAPVTRSF